MMALLQQGSSLPSRAAIVATALIASVLGVPGIGLPAFDGPADAKARPRTESAKTKARRAKSLPGKSYHYKYDGQDIKRPELAWRGRAYLPPEAASSGAPVPLVIFLHGLNAALIEHRWMGGGNEGDVRRIVGTLISQGKMAPAVIAGPSSVIKSQVARGASWRRFDLDNFIDRTVARLKAEVTIDTSRIIVAGHSGAGCSAAGGLVAAPKSRHRLLGILSIDTCMVGTLAKELGRANPLTHVIVSYQMASWRSRPIKQFRSIFEREVREHPAAPKVLREVVRLSPRSAPHNRMVHLSFQKWLPLLLPAAAPKPSESPAK